MRRLLALPAVVCLLALTACTDTSGGSDGEAGTVEEMAEEGLTGLALLHRGFEGGDPETDQVLVFHDPGTGQPRHRILLPEGAVDPMAQDLPVHAQFSEDWTYFAYATQEPNAVHVATLTDPEESDAEEVSYQPVESITPSADDVLSQPVVHGDRLWYVSNNERDGAPPQVLSVPLEAPAGTPNQEGSLALDEFQQPSDWALTPNGELHIRNSVQAQHGSVSGGAALVTRETADSLVNAALTIDGVQWRTFGDAPVWGQGTALLGPDDTGGDSPPGAYLVAVDGQANTATRLLEDGDGPMVQYAPAPERDAVLVQTSRTWFRVDLAEGEVQETTEAFPRLHDASLDGWPLAVRWVREAVEASPGQTPGEDGGQ